MRLRCTEHKSRVAERSHTYRSIRFEPQIGLHDREFDLDVVMSRPGVRTDLMCLFDELFCLCLVDARKMDIKLDRELKSWQRISRPTCVVCGFLLDLTECDMARYLNIAELFVLLIGHKTNRTGETRRVAGSKQLLGIRCTRFAWSTHFTRYTQIELHNAIRTFNVSVSSARGGRHGCI